MRNRRNFLGQLGMAAATLGMAPGALLAGGMRGTLAPKLQDDVLGHEGFQARLHHWFSFLDPQTGRRERMQLIDLQPGPATPRLDQFALIFRGESGAATGSGTYWVSDESGAGRALFVQSEGGHGRADRLRAEFCLLSQT